MTFEQLEAFLAAAEQNTFFDAAELLHISQSALSKQIIKLETELGVALFDRRHRHACLNDAGEEFYREALALHRQYLRMRTRMRRYQKSCGHTLVVGTLPILSQYGLTELLSDFSKQNPDIQLVLEEVEEPALMQGLSRGRFDCAIARESLLDAALYEMLPLAHDELVAILPASHPLLETNVPSSLSISQLAEADFLLMHRHTAVYLQCMQMFHAASINPRILRHARPESILGAVAVGEGVGLLPKSSLGLFKHQNIAAVSLSPAVLLPVVLAKPRLEKDTAAMKRLAEFIGSAPYQLIP